MKVIDLLNNIANGEEVPKKIMHNNIIYTWDIVGYLHYEDKHYSERAFLEGYRTDMCLNDEVEIVEDTPKEIYFDEEDIKAEEKVMKELSIEKKDNYNNYYKKDKKIEKLEITEYPELGENVIGYPVPERIIAKINEIIDKVNGE